MPLSDLELPEFIDTHFHLDVLIRKLKTMCKELNFDEVEGMLGPFHQHHLLFGIANYVYPSLWQCWREQVNTHSRIRLTFGIHSHMTLSSRMWRDLHQLMQEPICVAVGETGLVIHLSANVLSKGGPATPKSNIRRGIRQIRKKLS
jgi:Tat protein secretion system quality control protein TatD with DNase activity